MEVWLSQRRLSSRQLASLRKAGEDFHVSLVDDIGAHFLCEVEETAVEAYRRLPSALRGEILGVSPSFEDRGRAMVLVDFLEHTHGSGAAWHELSLSSVDREEPSVFAGAACVVTAALLSRSLVLARLPSSAVEVERRTAGRVRVLPLMGLQRCDDAAQVEIAARLVLVQFLQASPIHVKSDERVVALLHSLLDKKRNTTNYKQLVHKCIADYVAQTDWATDGFSDDESSQMRVVDLCQVVKQEEKREEEEAEQKRRREQAMKKKETKKRPRSASVGDSRSAAKKSDKPKKTTTRVPLRRRKSPPLPLSPATLPAASEVTISNTPSASVVAPPSLVLTTMRVKIEGDSAEDLRDLRRLVERLLGEEGVETAWSIGPQRRKLVDEALKEAEAMRRELEAMKRGVLEVVGVLDNVHRHGEFYDKMVALEELASRQERAEEQDNGDEEQEHEVRDQEHHHISAAGGAFVDVGGVEQAAEMHDGLGVAMMEEIEDEDWF